MAEPITPERETRVTTLELFFDLVFVFTITQLTSVLVDEPTITGVVRIVVMLGVIFWMYGGYAWLTNEIALDRLGRRLTLLAAMGALFVVALAVPAAFSGSGATFGLAYFAVVLIHLAMFARSSHLTVVQAVRGLAPFNLGTASLVVAGGIAGGTAQYVLWTAAFLGEWLSPYFFDDAGFVIAPAHFVERHGLVVIIAIGESVIAVGAGAAGLPVDADLVVAALLGLALSACLWWSHFGGDEGAPERAMRDAPVRDRPRLAIRAFGYWHIVILLGIVVMAAALKEGMHDPFGPLEDRWAILLAAGAAAFLAGEALFRRALRIGGDVRRATAAALALATIPLGTELAVTAQTAALVGLFVVLLATARGLDLAVARA